MGTMADKGGNSMSVDRLKRDLLNKLINARIDLAAYLQLRNAKGYMSVSESEHLRDNFFELCNFMREKAPILKAEYGKRVNCAAPCRRGAVRCWSMPDEWASRLPNVYRC
jgi:biofilm regulator BssR